MTSDEASVKIEKIMNFHRSHNQSVMHIDEFKKHVLDFIKLAREDEAKKYQSQRNPTHLEMVRGTGKKTQPPSNRSNGMSPLGRAEQSSRQDVSDVPLRAGENQILGFKQGQEDEANKFYTRQNERARSRKTDSTSSEVTRAALKSDSNKRDGSSAEKRNQDELEFLKDALLRTVKYSMIHSFLLERIKSLETSEGKL